MELPREIQAITSVREHELAWRELTITHYTETVKKVREAISHAISSEAYRLPPGSNVDESELLAFGAGKAFYDLRWQDNIRSIEAPNVSRAPLADLLLNDPDRFLWAMEQFETTQCAHTSRLHIERVNGLCEAIAHRLGSESFPSIPGYIALDSFENTDPKTGERKVVIPRVDEAIRDIREHAPPRLNVYEIDMAELYLLGYSIVVGYLDKTFKHSGDADSGRNTLGGMAISTSLESVA